MDVHFLNPSHLRGGSLVNLGRFITPHRHASNLEVFFKKYMANLEIPHPLELILWALKNTTWAAPTLQDGEVRAVLVLFTWFYHGFLMYFFENISSNLRIRRPLIECWRWTFWPPHFFKFSVVGSMLVKTMGGGVQLVGANGGWRAWTPTASFNLTQEIRG